MHFQARSPGFALFAILVLSLSTVCAGCSQKLGPAALPITEATLCKSVDQETAAPNGRTSTFSPSDTLYCVVKMADTGNSAIVEGKWTLLTVISADKECFLEPGVVHEETHMFDGALVPSAIYKLPPPLKGYSWKGGFPRGDYVFTLSIKGAEKVRLPFNVK